MNTRIVDSTEIQITLNLNQDQTITPEMLSLLKVNNAPLDFSGSGNASVSMGGTTGDIKAFINAGLDTSTEIHVNFGDNNSTINSSYTGFSWSGQLSTDYDNGTLEAEFTFSTENAVPTETDIKSHFMVKEDIQM